MVHKKILFNICFTDHEGLRSDPRSSETRFSCKPLLLKKIVFTILKILIIWYTILFSETSGIIMVHKKIRFNICFTHLFGEFLRSDPCSSETWFSCKPLKNPYNDMKMKQKTSLLFKVFLLIIIIYLYTNNNTV